MAPLQGEAGRGSCLWRSSMAQWEVSSGGKPHAANAPHLSAAQQSRIAAEHDSFRHARQGSIDDSRIMQDFEDMLREMEERVGGGAVKSTEQKKGRRVCEQHKTEFRSHCGEVCIVCGLVVRDIADIPPVFEERSRRQRVDIVETLVGSFGSDEDEDSSSEDCRSFSSESESRWEEEPAGRGLDTIEELAKLMQPHQKDGYNFVWRNLGGDAVSGEGAAGCILAHSPGTGKSLIVIAFMASYRKMHPRSKMLILAPLSMLYEWQAEFARWNVGIPFYILNSEEKASKESRKLVQADPGQRLHVNRSVILDKWEKNPGVLATTYHSLSNIIDDSKVLTGYAKKNRDFLVASTDLLVLDEGHVIRTKGKLRNAVLQVKTQRRVLLSGTLFQNNVQELRNLCYVVRPNCLDHELMVDGSDGEVRLEKKGPHFEEKAGSTTRVLRSGKTAAPSERLVPPRDRKQIAFDKKCKEMFPSLLKNDPESEERDREIRKWQQLTDPFVSSFDGKNLKNLRALYEYVIKVYPNSEQTAILETYLEEEKPSAMVAHVKTEKICIHPVLHSRKDELDKYKAYGRARPEDGVKTHIVMQLVEQTINLKERVVIFCMHVQPLDLLKRMFEERFGWVLLRDILMVDGKMDMEDRHKNLLALNNLNNDVKVILASTKAFAEGVSMVGASRVIHLGIEWNPSVNRQATCRAYRMGQKKDVHVYRLLACDTIEEAKYDAAISKDKLGRKILAPPDERWEGTVQMPSSTVLSELDDPVLERLTRRDWTRSIAQIVKLVEQPIDIAHVEHVEQVEQFEQVEHLVYSALKGQETLHHQRERETELQPKSQEDVRRPRGRPRKIIHTVSKEKASSPSRGVHKQEQVQATADHERNRRPGSQPQRQTALPRKRGRSPPEIQPIWSEEGSSTSEGEQESRKWKPDFEPKSQEKIPRPRGRPCTRIQRVWKEKATSTSEVEQEDEEVQETADQERRRKPGFHPKPQTILPRKRGRPPTPVHTIWSEESSSTSEGEQESSRKWKPDFYPKRQAKFPGSCGRPRSLIHTVMTSSSEGEEDPPTQRKRQDIIDLTNDESEDESEDRSEAF